MAANIGWFDKRNTSTQWFSPRSVSSAYFHVKDFAAPAAGGGGDPEGSLLRGKLLRGGLLQGVLVR